MTRVATQGRFGNGQGKEYAESFKFEYWRPGLDRFIRFKNRKGNEVCVDAWLPLISVKASIG